MVAYFVAFINNSYSIYISTSLVWFAQLKQYPTSADSSFRDDLYSSHS